MEVGEIEYEDGKITQLVILGDGQAIFTYDKRGSQTQNNERNEKTEQPEKNDELTLDKAYAMTTTKGKAYGELSDDQLQWIIDNARSAKSKRAAQIILDDRKTSEELLPIDAEEGLPF